MTQSLLSERFGLHVHRETKKEPVYLLVVAGGGLKSSPPGPSPPGQSRPNWPPDLHAGVRSMSGDFTMQQFAGVLSIQVDRPVLDHTGLSRKFGLKLWWGTNREIDLDVFEALEQQLGLKLIPGRGDVEYLVIDYINRTPTEN
jgi:uncharacterized protein (TIGR03435 family)